MMQKSVNENIKKWTNDIKARYIGGCCNKVIEVPQYYSVNKKIAHWIGCCDWSETQSFAIVTKQWLKRIRRGAKLQYHEGNATLRNAILEDTEKKD